MNAPAIQPDLKTQAEALIAALREQHITFCAGSQKLEHLTNAVYFAREKLPPALYIEAGVAMGGSAMLIALLKPNAARLKLFDVFDLLPPPTEKDGDKAQVIYEQFRQGKMQDATSRKYMEHTPTLLDFVTHNFMLFGIDPGAHKVEFVKGLFQDTMNIEEPVAFCHIDCDWYESVKYCIEQVKDRMVKEGLIVFDDYHSFEGCRLAVDEWLAADKRYAIASKAWNIVVQRVA